MSSSPVDRSRSDPPPRLGLGLDAGGTQTRWALADAQRGVIVAEGHVAGLSGLQLASESGRAALAETLQQLAAAVLAQGRPNRLQAGITGLPNADGADGADGANAAAVAEMKSLLARALQLPVEAMHCHSDIDIAWHAAFEQAGAGYLLYAGTGSVAAFVDADGRLQRAGGRGPLLGDEGGGFWIARQALAQLWRQEDLAPGSAAGSPLAQALFAALGGSTWARTRSFVYGEQRGRVGQLALAVAEAAAHDPAARALLYSAGVELARLAQALLNRFGARPIVAAGRALLLSPLIEQGLRETLPPGTVLQLQQLHPHRAAALNAARTTLGQE